MRSCGVMGAWGACAAALGIAVASVAGCGGSAASAAAAPSVVPSCANAQLPDAILDGPTGFAPGARIGPALPLLRVTGARRPLLLALADTERTRELGLMCVLRLRPGAGMLFAFTTTAREEFWMKNTLVPLDMVWLDETGLVTTVAADVPKSTLQTPDAAVARRAGTGRYVIELRPGEAAREGIAVGTRLALPAAPEPAGAAS